MSWQFHPATRFGEHAANWDRLQRGCTDTPFYDSAFIAPLLEEFGTGRELLALHQGPAGLDAAALVQQVGAGRWQTFQPSQLPLGPWIVPPGDDLEGRMRSLLRSLPGWALSLGVTQLDPRLHSRPAAAGETLRLQDYLPTSYIDVEGSFDAYWEARGKNLRQNDRKQRNKLAAEGVTPTLELVSTAEKMAGALEEYGRLESAGWKADSGTAIHPDNAQGRFYRSMLEGFAREGRARVLRYRFGDKVVAMDLCIDNGPLVVILKTAYDESYRQVSPSMLMRADEFRAWWAEGCLRRIEFYGKTMEWHTRWTGSERMMFHATLYRSPMVLWVREKLLSLRHGRAPESAGSGSAPAETAEHATR